jgi:hypothetical protein
MRLSNPCPLIVPLASVAVFQMPPESRKLLKRLKWGIFESYSAHHLSNSLQTSCHDSLASLLLLAGNSAEGVQRRCIDAS